MKITALDIRQKTFERAFRGVDKDEVDGFLLTISQQWERMTDENRELRRQLDQAQQDVQRMREVETSLYRTLKTAEDTSTSMVDQAQKEAELTVREAQKEAELTVREAQMEAEQLLSGAQQKARLLVDEAYRQAEKTVADMQHEVQGLGQEHQRLEGVYDTLVRDLQQLAGEVQQKADKAKERPRGAVAAILSKAASVKVVREESPSPATEPPMYVPAPAASSAAARIPATAPALAGGFDDTRSRSIGFEPIGPQPGKQPQPGSPSHPEISPKEPYENPGVAEPGRIHQPEPATVPNAPDPYVPTPAPDVQPVTPPTPEIAPQPAPHPGFAAAPAVAVETEKSFFDEI